MELVIAPVPDSETPTVVFGFTSETFSQCVYMTVDEDPVACLKYAETLADGFVAACGAAVQSAREVRNAGKGNDTTERES